MEIEKFIKVFKSNIPPKTISSLIKYFNNHTVFMDASVIGMKKQIVNKEIRKTKTGDFNLEKLSGIHWKNFLAWSIQTHLREYNKSHPTGVLQITALNPLLYEKGGFYKVHMDHHLKFPRTLSVIIFLNNDYEGGELNFHDPHDHKKIYKTIKPEPGKCVMWPSNFMYPHSVSEVTKGRRFTIVSWIL